MTRVYLVEYYCAEDRTWHPWGVEFAVTRKRALERRRRALSWGHRLRVVEYVRKEH